ncbi:MAG: pentapeptide repeat-containing protein [Candidatus Thorarchaeota archaeon]
MRRRNPIPKSQDGSPVKFVGRVSHNDNLDGEDLIKANLSRSDLRGSSFRNADLTGASLYRCDLRDCDFTGANLEQVNLAEAIVDGAVFRNCNMLNALLFDPAKLSKLRAISLREGGDRIGGFVLEPGGEDDLMGDMLVDLRDSPDYFAQYIELSISFSEFADDIDFAVSGTELTRHLLPPTPSASGANQPLDLMLFRREYIFNNLNFSGMDLSGADFKALNVDLEETPDFREDLIFAATLFIDCNLEGADLYMCSFWGSDFSGANLANAEVLAASFNECDMEGASLNGIVGYATFSRSDLSNADLRKLDEETILDSDWHEAVFTGAKFDNAQTWMSGAASLSADQLMDVIKGL